MKKILYIGNHLPSRQGLPTGIHSLSGNLRKEGYELITASGKRYRLPRLLHMLASVWRVRASVDFVLIDTYSTWNFWYAVAVGSLCRKLGLRYIPILHGGNLPERLQRSPRASKKLFGQAYVNVAPSEYLIQHSAFRIRSVEMKLVPNSLDLGKYAFRGRERVSPKLLWVRAFQDIYDPLTALKSLQQLLGSYPQAELCMVGPDKDGSLAECRAYAETHKLPVRFPGKLSREEWTAMAADYDLFLNTSLIDNTPVSVVEAMALGLPVVSTNAGGLPYLLQDGKEGLLVPPRNPEALTAALERLLEDPSLAQSLSHNARRKSETFDWEEVKGHWREILK